MTSMPVRSCLWALAVAWVVASGLYSFPAFQEEVAEKRYLARIGRLMPGCGSNPLGFSRNINAVRY